jgi:two-component system chemotaxis sensor kinase CheA
MVNLDNSNPKLKKILILDDDHFLLGMYSLKFHNSGYEVESVTSAKDALDKLRSGSVYDVVVFDIVMPSIDGFQFMEMVNKENYLKNTCFVALTNQSQQTDIERGKKLGVSGYIIKASTIPSEVVKEVDEILKNKNNN